MLALITYEQSCCTCSSCRYEHISIYVHINEEIQTQKLHRFNCLGLVVTPVLSLIHQFFINDFILFATIKKSECAVEVSDFLPSCYLTPLALWLYVVSKCPLKCLRATVCKYRESGVSREIFNFFIFCSNNLYSELFSKILLKGPEAL